MNKIDKTVLLEIQTNLGYFEYKDNRTVGTYSTLKQVEESLTTEDYAGCVDKPICLGCGNKFNKIRRDHIFCSEACRAKYRRKQKVTIIANCEYCGKEFIKRSVVHVNCTEDCRQKLKYTNSLKKE